MKGFIVQRKLKSGTRYYVTIKQESIDSRYGKQITFSSPVTGQGFSTKKEAQRFLIEKLSELETGTFVAPAKITFGQFLDKWLEVTKISLRPSTVASYEKNLRLHIKPKLGDINLQQLTVSDLDQLYSKLLQTGKMNTVKDQGLSPRTVQYIHTIIGKALKYAHKGGMVKANVSLLATPPKSIANPEKIQAWTLPELNLFLEDIKGNRLENLFKFYVATGVRRGEGLALTWRSIDWEKEYVTINASLGKVNGELVISTPKTKSGIRKVAIDRNVLAMLAEIREEQLIHKKTLGAGYFDQDLVFCDWNGKPYPPERITNRYTRIVDRLKKKGLPKIPLHGLRHTHATLLLASGANPRVIQERLGHSAIGTLLSQYVHVMPNQQAEVAELFSNLVEASKDQKVTSLRRA
jgi:integrase